MKKIGKFAKRFVDNENDQKKILSKTLKKLGKEIKEIQKYKKPKIKKVSDGCLQITLMNTDKFALRLADIIEKAIKQSNKQGQKYTRNEEGWKKQARMWRKKYEKLLKVVWILKEGIK